MSTIVGNDRRRPSLKFCVTNILRTRHAMKRNCNDSVSVFIEAEPTYFESSVTCLFIWWTNTLVWGDACHCAAVFFPLLRNLCIWFVFVPISIPYAEAYPRLLLKYQCSPWLPTDQQHSTHTQNFHQNYAFSFGTSASQNHRSSISVSERETWGPSLPKNLINSADVIAKTLLTEVSTPQLHSHPSFTPVRSHESMLLNSGTP